MGLISAISAINFAASLITIVTLAVHTCRHISHCLRRISKVSVTVQHCSLRLQALASTFGQLQSLGTEMRLHNQLGELPATFDNRLNECATDLRVMAWRVDRVRHQLERGRFRRTWTQIRYLLFEEQGLKDFFERIHMYRTDLSLDLIIFQA